MSYDPTHELYREINIEFAKKWEAETGEDITLHASHDGSGKQTRSMIDRLDADVVTLALGYDINAIVEKSLTSKDWQKRLSHNASPYTSTIMFLVRKGNPKGIRGWNDLIKPGIVVITPDPKTSDGTCQNYLAAWTYALKQPGGSDATAKNFVQKLYKDVPIFDSGACGATTTFTECGIGDVLIAWGDEALLATRVEGKDKFDMMVPSISTLAKPPVAVVDKVADKKGTHKAVETYLKFLYTPRGQETSTRNFYRLTDPAVTRKRENEFPKVKLVIIDDMFGGWQKTQRTHFVNGRQFDQFYQPGR